MKPLQLHALVVVPDRSIRQHAIDVRQNQFHAAAGIVDIHGFKFQVSILRLRIKIPYEHATTPCPTNSSDELKPVTWNLKLRCPALSRQRPLYQSDQPAAH